MLLDEYTLTHSLGWSRVIVWLVVHGRRRIDAIVRRSRATDRGDQTRMLTVRVRVFADAIDIN